MTIEAYEIENRKIYLFGMKLLGTRTCFVSFKRNK